MKWSHSWRALAIDIFDRLFLNFEGIEASSVESIRSIMIIDVRLELDFCAIALILILLHRSNDYVEMELSEELVSSSCLIVVVVQWP